MDTPEIVVDATEVEAADVYMGEEEAEATMENGGAEEAKDEDGEAGGLEDIEPTTPERITFLECVFELDTSKRVRCQN